MKRLLFKTKSLAVASVLLCAFLVSCKKDRPDTQDLLAYAPPGNAAYNVIKGGSIAILRNTILSGANTSFPVLLTRAYTGDVQVTARIDTGLVKAYDSLYKTSSPSLPAGAFTLAGKGTATVMAGKTKSTDSLQVQLTDASKIRPGTNIYVVPVVLASATGGVPVSDTRQVMYMQVTITSIASSLSDFSNNHTVGILLYNLGNTVIGPNTINLRASLNASVSQSVKVSVVEDATLIATYNMAHNSAYKPFPSGAYQLSKDNATVAAGSVVSTDSIQVRLLNLSSFDPAANYLLAIRIKDDNSAGSPPADTSMGNNIVYITLGTSTTPITSSISDFSGNHSVSVVLNRAPGSNTNTGPGMISLRASLNVAISQAVQVSVQEDATLIDAYNTAHNTAYKPFPSGSYQLSKDNATVLAGKTMSTDSIQVRLSDLSLFDLSSVYLLAIRIKDDNLAPGNTSNGNNIVYIVLSVFVNNVDPANPVVAGTVMSRTGWTVTSSGGDDDYLAASRVLDGDNSTAWDGQGSLPEALQLDMGAAQAVKGFAIVPSYEYTTDDFINMEIYSSNDGTVWKLEGKYVGTATSSSSSASSPDIKNVKFITPVTARYFKFNITATSPGSSNYAGMAELNAVD